MLTLIHSGTAGLFTGIYEFDGGVANGLAGTLGKALWVFSFYVVHIFFHGRFYVYFTDLSRGDMVLQTKPQGFFFLYGQLSVAFVYKAIGGLLALCFSIA